ncbi:MAG: hypothetical protein JKY65_24400 [Planctomycetes bacterium]|nr:hypothetical protein [Planctomycetota bacterium]
MRAIQGVAAPPKAPPRLAEYLAKRGPVDLEGLRAALRIKDAELKERLAMIYERLV